MFKRKLNAQHVASESQVNTTDWSYMGAEGFADPLDWAAQQHQLINTQLAVQMFEYQNNFQLMQGTSYADVGDEYYGGSSFAYIPTEVQVASAVALMNRNFPNEGPVYYDEPGMTQLVNGLYKNAQTFWKELARANQTGW